jgi:hypothetical protein
VNPAAEALQAKDALSPKITAIARGVSGRAGLRSDWLRRPPEVVKERRLKERRCEAPAVYGNTRANR